MESVVPLDEHEAMTCDISSVSSTACRSRQLNWKIGDKRVSTAPPLAFWDSPPLSPSPCLGDFIIRSSSLLELLASRLPGSNSSIRHQLLPLWAAQLCPHWRRILGSSASPSVDEYDGGPTLTGESAKVRACLPFIDSHRIRGCVRESARASSMSLEGGQ